MKYIKNTATLILILAACSKPQVDQFDHSIFDKLLKENVDSSGMINYEAFKDNSDFNTYLEMLANAKIENLSDNEKLAFYINAYNATVINNVLNHSPLNSPMDVDGFFNKIKHTVTGNDITLDELEHKFTLPIEPVLSHFGLVCAAKSCPKIINNSYDGETVYNQLDKNVRVFLNDENKNRLDRENKVLYLSEIFKWFKNAFIERYGSLKNTASAFINESDANFLKENEVDIKFLKYNWELNSQ